MLKHLSYSIKQVSTHYWKEHYYCQYKLRKGGISEYA